VVSFNSSVIASILISKSTTNGFSLHPPFPTSASSSCSPPTRSTSHWARLLQMSARLVSRTLASKKRKPPPGSENSRTPNSPMRGFFSRINLGESVWWDSNPDRQHAQPRCLSTELILVLSYRHVIHRKRPSCHDRWLVYWHISSSSFRSFPYSFKGGRRGPRGPAACFFAA
jgi:hypothetical protein